MSLMDEVEASTNHAGKGRCGYPAIIQALDPSDRADLEKAVADPSVQQSAIIRVLTARGLSANKEMIRRHRDGTCRACRIS